MTKRKYVEIEAIRKIAHYDSSDTYYTLEPTIEIIEINSDMVNVFTDDETDVNGVVVCKLKFSIRANEQERYPNFNLYIYCTLDQATKNIKLIGKELMALAEECNAANNVEQDENTVE